MHDVVVSSVVSNDMNKRRKYTIRRDEDVYFLLVCDRPVHEIYVGASTSNFTPSPDVPLWEGDHRIPLSFADDYEQSDDNGISLPSTSCHTPEHLSDDDC
ncbi:hypothetical protein ACOSQ2_013947 [Xanthoceras sorbifolium]